MIVFERNGTFAKVATGAILISLGLGCRLTQAGEASAGSGWKVRAVPYLWLTGIETDVEIPQAGGGTAALSFGDLWTVQEYGGSLYVEAQRDRLAIIGDGIYLQDEFPSQQNLPAAVADVEQLTGELSVAYRPEFLEPIEFVVGLLATNLKLNVSVEDGSGVVIDDSWIDPLVGLRFRSEVGRNVTLMLRSDVGGFGINDAKLIRLVIEGNLYFTDRAYFLTAYRFGYLDYDTDVSKADVTINGLALGLGYHF